MQRPSVQSLPLRQLCKGRMTSINGVTHENSNTSLLVQQLQAALPPAAQAAAANSLNRWRRCAHRELIMERGTQAAGTHLVARGTQAQHNEVALGRIAEAAY